MLVVIPMLGPNHRLGQYRRAIIRERVHLWVPLVVGTFSVSFLLVFALPAPLQSFLLVFPLMLVAYCVPLGAYIVVRNARVEEHEKVFTSDHLRHVMARWLQTARRQDRDRCGNAAGTSLRGRSDGNGRPDEARQ